jgi:hypothetical protein
LGAYSVSGSHAYAASGPESITVTITDPEGSPVVAGGSAVVAPPPVYTVATFTATDLSLQASDFIAVINWGDGSPTTVGIVTGSSGNLTVTGTHAYLEEGDYPVTVTVTHRDIQPGSQGGGTAHVGEAFLAAAGAPPAPPAGGKKDADAIPGHAVTFAITSPAGVKLTPTSPPVRVHVDDNFDLGVLDGNTALANNQPDRAGKFHISDTDSNVVKGTLTVGPAGQVGILLFTYPASVKVWWKPAADWVVVSNNPVYKATGAAIPILIQGMQPGSGTVRASFTIQQPGKPDQVQSASINYTTFTGLNVGGAAAALLGQLTIASSYTFVTDAAGNVWRRSRPLLPLLTKYQYKASDYVNDILSNYYYAKYQAEPDTGKVPTTATVVVTAAAGNSPAPDLFYLATLFPVAYTQVQTNVGGDNGKKVMAGMLVHALVEQYHHQIFGKKYETNPAAVKNHDAGGAFGEGVKAEEAVLGWGDRTQEPRTLRGLKLAKGQTTVTIKIVYADAGGKKTVLAPTYTVVPGPPTRVDTWKLTLP